MTNLEAIQNAEVRRQLNRLIDTTHANQGLYDTTWLALTLEILTTEIYERARATLKINGMPNG